MDSMYAKDTKNGQEQGTMGHQSSSSGPSGELGRQRIKEQIQTHAESNAEQPGREAFLSGRV